METAIDMDMGARTSPMRSHEIGGRHQLHCHAGRHVRIFMDAGHIEIATLPVRMPRQRVGGCGT